MNDQERQLSRQAKQMALEQLSLISLQDYHLASIDERLEHYAQSLMADTSAHNGYELLALARFFHLLDDSRYEFRTYEARRFINFYEHLKFSNDKLGRCCYKMTSVQVFQFCSIMGFYVKASGERLTRTALLFVPRKFSKTTSVASLAVWDFLYGDTNAQAYCASNSYKQSQVCFKEIKGILKSLDPKLRQFKLNREHIEWLDNPNRSSFIDCLANNPDKLDGLNASMVIMDEYAQADSAELYGVLTTSMGIRTNPLTAIITTASDKPDGPFAHQLEGFKRILRGEVVNDRAFIHIFEPDADDSEDDPHTWAKVQPHLGITVRNNWYEEQWRDAQLSAENMKNFRTKLLNVFDTGNEDTWITGETIRSLYRNVDIDNLGYRADCEVAVDLSTDNDFSAVSYYVYLRNERKAHIHTEYYFPEDRIPEHRNRELYRRWADEGYLKLCKGRIIDFNQITNDILAHGRFVHIYRLGFDPAKSRDFQNVMKCAYPGAGNYLFPYKQTYYAFTSPVQSMQRLVETKNITFNENPINAFCFDNCVLDTDRNDLSKPLKRGANLKIDGAITALMALGLAETEKR